ncbi:MAG TPA: hypothetical protein VK207_09015 [Bacteroidales bacterium]|nr:hypothetical protein [Bacteroidales bacterium]
MNDVTKRFLEAYNFLLSEHRVSDQKEFASKIGVSTSMMTEIIKGRSNVGLTAIQNTVLVFAINSQWIFTGEGEMDRIDVISDSSVPYGNKLIGAQADTIETLKKLVQHLENENKKLKEQLQEKEKPAEADGQKRKAG